MKISFLKLKCFRAKDIFSLRTMNVLIYFFDFIFNLTALGREQKAFLNFVHSLCDKVYDKYVIFCTIKFNVHYKIYYYLDNSTVRKQIK